jgi:hypothetical protein
MGLSRKAKIKKTTAERAVNRLATLELPPQRMAECVSDPAAFNGTHQHLDVFVAHLGIPLFSDYPVRQGHPTHGLCVHRLEGGAQAHVFRFAKNSVFLLTDFEDIIRIQGSQ